MKTFQHTLLMLSACLLFGIDAPSVFAQSEEPSATDSLQAARKHLSFGNNYFKNKQYKDAEAQLLKAWSYLPNQENTHTKRAQCARLLGRVYHETEQYDNAIKWYQEAIALGPNDTHNKSAYRSLANLYMYQDKRQDAIDTFEKLLAYELDPATEIEYLYHLVVLSNEQQDFDRALQYANRWAELTPEDPRVLELLGKLHMRTGDEDEAVAQMEKVMTMDPNDFKTLSDLATQYQNRGDFDKAFEAYERLHKHDTQNYLYLEKLRTLSRQLQKPEPYQLGILEKMHHIQPNNLSVVETLADKTEALQWIQKGLKLDPKNGRLQYLMGEVAYKKWQTSQALADSTDAMNWYQKALSDSTWKSQAQYMIDIINPPKTAEQLAADIFFKKDKKEGEAKQEGKK